MISLLVSERPKSCGLSSGALRSEPASLLLDQGRLGALRGPWHVQAAAEGLARLPERLAERLYHCSSVLQKGLRLSEA